MSSVTSGRLRIGRGRITVVVKQGQITRYSEEQGSIGIETWSGVNFSTAFWLLHVLSNKPRDRGPRMIDEVRTRIGWAVLWAACVHMWND